MSGKPKRGPLTPEEEREQRFAASAAERLRTDVVFVDAVRDALYELVKGSGGNRKAMLALIEEARVRLPR